METVEKGEVGCLVKEVRVEEGGGGGARRWRGC